MENTYRKVEYREKKRKKENMYREDERDVEHLLLPESRVAWTGSERVQQRELHLRSGSKVHASHDTETKKRSTKRKKRKKKFSRSNLFFPPSPPLNPRDAAVVESDSSGDRRVETPLDESASFGKTQPQSKIATGKKGSEHLFFSRASQFFSFPGWV
jgi:hypothetical protein